jgi:exopolyphosphatase/guanosine-5'-triphosphate,3'-diphosphate pyrophosphatase
LPETESATSGSALIIDIGGGSTEWIIYRDRDHVEMGSIPIGVIRLTQKFLKNDPVSETDVIRLNSEISPIVEDLRKRIGPLISKDTQFIGTAGTFTTIASIDMELDGYCREKIHLYGLDLHRLKNMFKRLRNLPLYKRREIRGLEPERADLIIPGVLFTIKIMEFFEFPELVISDYGLLEGTLLELKETTNGKNISAARES